MNIYNILKAWYEYKAEHSDLTGNHTDFLFYCIDLNNRLAWKEEFGLPAMESAQFLGISYNTFRKLLKDFTEKYKLIRLVKASKNQYVSNVISLDLLYQNLLKQKKSTYKAFVKAQQKQMQSTCDIDRQYIHKDIKDIKTYKDNKKNSINDQNLFEKFWEIYPKKKGRGVAEKSFKKAISENDPREIFAGLKLILESGEWTDYQFIPYPATWLNQERWKDSVLKIPQTIDEIVL
jgi:hypothetical protein